MSRILEKKHLLKLKITSLSGSYYKYIILFILISFSITNIYLLIVGIIYLMLIRKNISFKTLIFFLIIFIIIFLFFLFKKYFDPFINIGFITNKDDNLYTIQIGIRKYMFYSNEKIDVASVVNIKYVIEKYKTSRQINSFNLNNYMLSKNIYGSLNVEKLNVLFKTFNYKFLSNALHNYFDSYNNITGKFLDNIFFSKYDAETKINYANLNIAYLISLSGIYYYSIDLLIKKVCYFLDIEYNRTFFISSIIISVIGFIQGFPFVYKRFILFQILRYFNKEYNFKLTSLDITSIVCFIFLINLNNVYNIGFIITFIVIYISNLTQYLYKNKSNLLNIYISNLVIYLSLIPILNNMNIEINLIVFIFTPILIIIFRYLIVYLILISIIFYPISYITSLIINSFNLLINEINKLNILFYLPYFDNISIIIYYIVLLFLLANYNKIKYYFIFFLTTILFMFKGYITFSSNIYFLDVGQGDSTIVTTPFLNDVVVIDAYNNVLNSLKNLGIRHIDLLILTHPDFDHIKEGQKIIDNIKVKKVIINNIDNYNIFHNNIKKIKKEETIYTKSLKLDFFYQSKKYLSKNNNSIVFKTSINNNSILFTGDIERDREYDLINLYSHKLKADILKVAHHGSKTSSSQKFIDIVNPKYAIFSYGKNNFKIPSNEVINRYISNNTIIYKTYTDYTIKVSIIFDKIYFLKYKNKKDYL